MSVQTDYNISVKDYGKISKYKDVEIEIGKKKCVTLKLSASQQSRESFV